MKKKKQLIFTTRRKASIYEGNGGVSLRRQRENKTKKGVGEAFLPQVGKKALFSFSQRKGKGKGSPWRGQSRPLYKKQSIGGRERTFKEREKKKKKGRYDYLSDLGGGGRRREGGGVLRVVGSTSLFTGN